MSKPVWSELSSAERMDEILIAVDGLTFGDAHASAVAQVLEGKFVMEPINYARDGRRPNMANRLIPGLRSLRKRGLIWFCSRRDGLSGTADALTESGRHRVDILKIQREGKS